MGRRLFDFVPPPTPTTRKALLIGYTGSDLKGEGLLKGVPLDLINYKNYLMSIQGGAWKEEEIVILENTNLKTLEKKLDCIQSQKHDIVFTVFSGHGDYSEQDQCRRLELNKHEIILESELLGLAERQILICDSCSGIESKREVRIDAAYESENIDQGLIKEARSKYEKWFLACEPQILRFYASKIGTYAEDTSVGGLYTKTLIEVLKNAQEDMSIVRAHDIAEEKVQKMTSTRGGHIQIPERQIPRIKKFLPGAIIL